MIISWWLSACILLHVRLTNGRLHGDDDNYIEIDHHTHGHVNRHLAEDNEHTRFYGTKPMTETDRIAQDTALEYVKHKKKKHGEAYNADSPQIIPTCFHSLVERNSRRSIFKDLEALNKAYSANSCCDESLSWCSGNCTSANPHIQFVMARSLFGKYHLGGTTKNKHSFLSCISFKPFGFLRSLEEEFQTKRKARVGGNRVLNIYIYSLPWDNIGWAYPPSILLEHPEMDGVVINRDYRFGGEPEYSGGGTLAHLVG